MGLCDHRSDTARFISQTEGIRERFSLSQFLTADRTRPVQTPLVNISGRGTEDAGSRLIQSETIPISEKRPGGEGNESPQRNPFDVLQDDI